MESLLWSDISSSTPLLTSVQPHTVARYCPSGPRQALSWLTLLTHPPAKPDLNNTDNTKNKADEDWTRMDRPRPDETRAPS